MSADLAGFVVSLLVGSAVYWLDVRGRHTRERRTSAWHALTITLLTLVIASLWSEHQTVNKIVKAAVPRVESPMLRSVVDEVAALDSSLPGVAASTTTKNMLLEPLRFRLSRGIDDMHNGFLRLETSDETIGVFSQLLSRAHSVLVTSYVDPSQWWTARVGGQYDTLTWSLIRHGGRFERVFIVDDVAEAQRLRRTMLRQQARGIRVRYVLSTDLEPNLRRDFFVVDSVVAAEMLLDGRRRFQESRFYLSPMTARDFLNYFHQISITAKQP
jgi:hypothetical protein